MSSAVPYAILYLTPAAISAALAFYGWQRRSVEGAAMISLLMTAVAFWCLCHALSVSSSGLRATLFWAQLQYAGIVLVPPFWLLFALAYSRQLKRASLAARAALFVPPALAFGAVLTTEYHHLWWTQIALDTSRPFSSLAIGRGPLFWMFFGYTYACVLVGLGLFVQTMLEAPPLYRRQAQLIVVGALVPALGNIAHVAGLPTRVVDDPTPFLFAVSGMVFFYAARRYHLLNFAPIAQREIYESMPDGVIVLDQNGHVVSINEPVPRLLGVRINAWAGATLAQVVAGSPIGGILAAMASQPGQPQSRALTYDAPDGLRGVEVRLRPLLAGRRQIGTLLVLRDTTDRERAQRALSQRLSEATLLNQIARAANAIAPTDELLRTIAGAITDLLPWDRALIALLDTDGASLRLVADQPGDSAGPLVGSNVAADTFTPVLEALRTDEPRVVQASDPALAGSPVAAALSGLKVASGVIVPLVSQSVPLGVLFCGSRTIRQVSPDEVRLFETVGKLIGEAVLRARLYDEAQQANMLKSTFLATVTHELRTPLSSIMGYAEMLQRGLFGLLPEPMHDPVMSIHRSGAMLLSMINDILDYSRMEADRFDVELHPVDLAAVVRATAAALQPQMFERQLALQVELAPDLPLVLANSGRLEQVLTNLVANAIKFTEAGTITIRAARHGAGVRLSVADTGIGIPPERQGEIFQAFRQLDTVQRRRYGGAGLGLAISRRLVELMGGRIGVESTPGVGSTFYCDLQALPDDPDAALSLSRAEVRVAR
jgi:PAS domain S-box-containing protein